MITLRQCHDKEEWDDYILENGGHPLQLGVKQKPQMAGQSCAYLL